MAIGVVRSISFKQLFSLLVLAGGALLFGSVLSAWTGPISAAPNSNTSFPINVGSTDQVKDAGLSVNALAVFGSGYTEEKWGVRTENPLVALDVNGSVKVGNGGETCSSSTEGGIRYNTSTDTIQFCNATEWADL